MIAIPATKASPHVGLAEDVGGFCIDRFEVTNRDYQRFVDDGGYQNPAFWKHEFLRDGKTITREEALAAFCDQTGRLGPATWSTGHFPLGEEKFPVRGVSWYEAAAYAESQGKSLPTVHHWWWAGHGRAELILPLANFANPTPPPPAPHTRTRFFPPYSFP